MRSTFYIARATAPAGPPIDVLAFPPDRAQLNQQRTNVEIMWRERERRARVVLFLGAGMFVAWAADVGAAFELAHSGGSTFFGVASVPLALTVVLAHIFGRWALERASRGMTEALRTYSDVTLREAVPLLKLASDNPPVAQYLRCVGRQGRPLIRRERIALHAWVNTYENPEAATPPART